jgi:cytochrome c oxidase assembly protein subunit 15
MDHPWLHRYAVLLAVWTLALLAAGALVTSNEAGLSVPDWPLSYGRLMPEMTGGVFYEHGHRMVATGAGLLTIGLVVWLYRARRAPRWLRRLSLVALAAVVVQGVLGGLTVLLRLPPAVSIAHACLAQLFFALTVAFAMFTSQGWQAGPDPVGDQGWPPLRALAVAAPVAVLMQTALGAAFRHRVLGVLPHILGAMAVSLLLLILAAFVLHQFPAHRMLRPAASALLGATMLQVLAGIAAYLARAGAGAAKTPAMLAATTAHVAGGGLVLAATLALAILVFRNVAPGPRHAADPRAAVAP